MKFNLKNVLFSIAMFVSVLALVGLVSTNKAEAAPISSNGTGGGAWSDIATWGGGVVPGSSDAVTILSGDVITVDTVALAASVLFDTTTVANGITISGTNSLTVSGNITMTLPTAGPVNQTIAVGAGTLSAVNIAMVGSTTAGRNVILSVSTGTINVTGNITFGADATTIAQSQVISTGDSDINIGGNFGTGTNNGTLTTSGTGRITFNGTGAQSMGIHTTYNNVTIAGTGNTVTASGTTTVGGTLDVTTGTFAAGTSTLTVTGTTTVATGGTVTNTGGTVVMSTLNINGSGTMTNSATLTIGTALGGTGALINAATGTLNIGFGGVPTITTLTATAVGNVVNYVAASPSCKATAYDILNFTNSGAVVCATTSAKDITLGGTVTWTTSASPTLTGTLTVGAGTTLNNTVGYTITAPTVSVAATGALNNAGTLTSATVITIAGTLTNTGTVNATASLTGVGSFVNSTNGTLNLGGVTFDVSTLTLSAAGNTVNYNRANVQTVRAGVTNYVNLGLLGTGIKTVGAGKTISGNLTIGNGAKAALTGDTTANRLILGNSTVRAGIWGAVGTATVVYASDDFFSGTAGKVTAANGRSVSYIGDIDNTETTTTTGSNGTTTTTTTTTTPSLIVTAVSTTTTPTATTISGCEGKTSGFSTVNGLSCSGNTTTVTTTTPLVIAGCSGGTTGFSTVNGQSCATNGTSVTTSNTYNFGTKTLRNGSRGDSVKELQRFLNKFLKMNLKEDGALGPKTIKVIKQWQKDHGLVADGLVGAKTKAMMNKEAEDDKED